MILIFTSVRVNRPLYKRDILNVCCEPPDSQVQFAYQLKWVAQPLRSSPQALKDKDALIVYCERTDDPNNYFSFHPVRRAVIAAANAEAEFLTLSLKLGDFVDYAAYGDDVGDVIGRFQALVTDGQTDHPNNTTKSAKGEAKARFVREHERWPEAKFSKEWVSLVSYLDDIDGMNDAVFFCVQDRNKFGGAPVPLFPNPANEDNPTSYLLKSGGSYGVSVFLMWGHGAKYRDPELVVKESLASVSGPFVRQRSSGFQADFFLQCKRSFDAESGMLTLRVPAEANIFDSPVADVLIKLSPRKGILALAVGLLTVGGLFISLTPEILGQLPLIRFIEPRDWLSLVFKIVGVIMLGVGSYVGFRKLPSGAAG